MTDSQEEQALLGLRTSVQRRIGRDLLQLLREQSESEQAVLPPERELSKRLEVSRPTLRLVLQELEEAGLIRNLSSRGRILVGASESQGSARSVLSQTVAILTPEHGMEDIHRQQARMPGWAYHTAQAVYDSLHHNGWHALGFSPNQMNESQVQRLIADRPAGIVIVMLQWFLLDQQRRQLLEPLREAGIPMVSQNLPSEGLSVDSVDSDQAAGARKLVQFLAERGHKRILRLWGRPQHEREIPLWLELRNKGCEAAAQEAGVEILPPIYYVRSVPEGLSGPERFEHEVRLSAGFLLEHIRSDSPPDAIMTISDAEHYEAAAACEMLGVKPQQDVTIVGYDNYWREVDGAILRPDLPAPAATIDKHNARVGHALVELLRQRIDGQLGEAPEHRVIEPELIIPQTS